MKEQEVRPPQYLLTFFRWICKPELLEEIEGDLNETFYYYSDNYKSVRAKWLFFYEFLKLMRPTVILSFPQLINKTTNMKVQTMRLAGLLAAAAVLLSIPFFAMMFTSEVKWSAFDFLIAAVLLFGTAFILEFLFRRIKTFKYRMLFAAIVLLILFLIWAELAVGIFGTPFAGS